MKPIFDKSQEGQSAFSLPKSDAAFSAFSIPSALVRKEAPQLPEVSEIDITRHYSQLARLNMSIDTNFYPLGSCTMKLNPRVNEQAAALPGFLRSHPMADAQFNQGNLRLMWELERWLAEISGMQAGTLLPQAGAQGEFVGIKLIAAYHQDHNQAHRTEMLIPDNAHGTNPATAAMAGFSVITVKSGPNGDLDIEDLKKHLGPRTAGLMMTNPNTLGVFSPSILQIAELVHEAGGLLYYDGANLNPILNVARPGDMGFDVMHINLHKTFSTPHGGGGPGSGPVLCNSLLEPYLPVPRVVRSGNEYDIVDSHAKSIGRITSFWGNFGMLVRAYLYIKLHGHFGLRRIAEIAVLNANYLKAHISKLFCVPYSQPCMHEFVVQADRFLGKGIRALDLVKRLMDYGIHAPTIYFPLIVKECLLIEPTESESKATLDNFLAVLRKICEECENDPELILSAPHNLPLKRLDEVRAAKQPVLQCCSC